VTQISTLFGFGCISRADFYDGLAKWTHEGIVLEEERDMIIPYKNMRPKIAEDVFIAPTAVLIGDIEVQEGASIWFGAVLRADHGKILIGRGSNVQDNVTIHVSPRGDTLLGEDVSVGHGAILEGCKIGRGCVVGMNAVVLEGAVVGAEVMIAAGSVVMEGFSIPDRKLVAGVPARVKKELVGTSLELIQSIANSYQKLQEEYRNQGIDMIRQDSQGPDKMGTV